MAFLCCLLIVAFVHSRVMMNSTNWPVPNVWVLITKLVEHYSANAEAMCSNPVEVPELFTGLICNCLLQLPAASIISSFKFEFLELLDNELCPLKVSACT